MSRLHVRVICVVAWAGSMALPAAATAGQPASAQESSREAESGPEHRNELALILAGTYEDEETHFTTGLEYERRLIELLGVGGAFEYLAGKDSWVFVAATYFHVYKGLKFEVGAGFEREDGENEFLLRLGAAYGFEFRERFSVTPSVTVDFIGREEALVFGGTFGFAF